MKLLWPLENPIITQYFGENPNKYGYGPEGHKGVDLRATVGTKLRSPQDAEAIGLVQPELFGQYMRFEINEHMTAYIAHLSQIDREGQVECGDHVALSGETGNCDGAHVHFELRIDGVSVDPLPYMVEEMNMSKTGLSFQTMPEWAHGMTVPTGFPILIINPPEDNPFPGAFIIGRAWIGGDGVEQAMIDKGAAGGREYFERCKEFYDKAPYVDVWLGPNEPKPWWDKLQFLDEFNGAWIPSMHNYGKQTGAGVFSVGEPQLDYLQTMRKTCALTDYLVAHQYGNPSMQYEAEWLSLRHRKVVQKLHELNYRVPPILITECGIDGGAILGKDGDKYKKPGQGWVTVIGDKVEFLSQMEWWDDELCKDPDVKYAVTFISGPNGDWVSFIWDEQMARWAMARFTQVPVEITDEDVREAAWNAVGVDYNPDAALTKYAQEHGLGMPTMNEDYSLSGYVIQGFIGAILKVKVGEWDNIEQVEW